MTRRVTARSRAGSRLRPLGPARAGVAAVACAAVLAGLGVPADAAAAPGGRGAELVVTGTVERVHLDDFGSHDGDDRELTFLTTADGAVQLPTSALEHVPDGARVRVGLADSRTAEVSATGVRPTLPPQAAVTRDPEAGATVTGVDLVAEQGASLTDTGTGAVAEPSTAAAAAPHQVLVVVATPSNGSASSVSAADVAATINGSVDAYWRTVTGGAVSFSASAYPSVVSTSTTPCSNGSIATSFDFWDEIKAKTGWTEGAGKHLVVYFRTLSACGGVAGLGTIGTSHASGGLVWSNGYNTTGVLGHELGHNLSLGHSQALDCIAGGVRSLDGSTTQCTKRSYADTNDIMAVSWQNQGFLNASHLRYLGLLESGAEVAPTDNGSVALAPLASGSGTRALTLADGGNRYVVEYRAAVGQDSWMAGMPGWGSIGVTVRKEFDPALSSSFSLRESLLLDGVPATPDSSFGQLDVALPVGVWIDLAGGRLGLRVVSQDAGSAVVEYRNGPASGDTRYVAPPMPTLTPPVATLRGGAITRSYSAPVVPVRWTWKWTSADGSSSAWKTSIRTGLATTAGNPWAYRATATAPDGSTVSSVGRATAYYRTDAAGTIVRYSGSFTKASTSSALGGSVHRSSSKGAKVTLTVKSRSVGLLLQRGPRYGWVKVYVDGVRVASLNLRASSTSTRVAWVRNFGALDTRRITIVNASGGAYGRVGFDGFVRL